MKTAAARTGFTLIELCSMVAVLTFGCALVLPAVGRSAPSAAALCMNNFRQLMRAASLYDSDFRLLPPNPDDGNSVPGHNWCAGNFPPASAAFVTNKNYFLLLPYLESARVLKCPSDPSTYRFQGKNIPTPRSAAMSHAAGTICAGYDAQGSHSGRPDRATNGPWLNGSHSHRRGQTWLTFASTGGIPNPAKTWLFLEEDYRSLNDANLATGLARPEWIDYPAIYHNFGCSFAFTDGHVELHHWKEKSTRITGTIVSTKAISADQQSDWAWLASGTSEKIR